jgi:hypothetical protein
MSIFTGKQSKGAMRRHREDKRDQAEARNAAADVSRRVKTCGHVHGSRIVCPVVSA